MIYSSDTKTLKNDEWLAENTEDKKQIDGIYQNEERLIK